MFLPIHDDNPRRSPPIVTLLLKAGAPLNEWDLATFYTPGPHGYTDYPALETEAA